MARSGSKYGLGRDFVIAIGELPVMNLTPMQRASRQALLAELRRAIQNVDRGIQSVVQNRHRVPTFDSSISLGSSKDSIGTASMAREIVKTDVSGSEAARPDQVGPSLIYESNWASEEVAKFISVYGSPSGIVELRMRVSLSTIKDEGLFVCRPCGEEERVYMDLVLDTDLGSIYVYETFFTYLRL